jgi:uncharacterized membrane protein
MATDNTSTNSNVPHINLATTDQAMGWLRDGWDLFKRAPGIWIAILVIYVVISLVASYIPFVGGMALALFEKVLTFGILSGVRDLEAGNPLTIDHLFAGFSSPRRGSLILLGLLALIGSLCLGVLTGVDVIDVLSGSDPGVDAAKMSIGTLLLSVVLFAVLSAAFAFAAPLVGFNGLSPIEAVKLSFSATVKNWLPLLVWGVLAILLVVAGAIPLGLGLLAVLPTLAASDYLVYRTIFTTTEPAVANPGG